MTKFTVCTTIYVPTQQILVTTRPSLVEAISYADMMHSIGGCVDILDSEGHTLYSTYRPYGMRAYVARRG